MESQEKKTLITLATLAAHERIIARSAEVEAKTGIQSSSMDLIRQLRSGEGRRD